MNINDLRPFDVEIYVVKMYIGKTLRMIEISTTKEHYESLKSILSENEFVILKSEYAGSESNYMKEMLERDFAYIKPSEIMICQ